MKSSTPLKKLDIIPETQLTSTQEQTQDQTQTQAQDQSELEGDAPKGPVAEDSGPARPSKPAAPAEPRGDEETAEADGDATKGETAEGDKSRDHEMKEETKEQDLTEAAQQTDDATSAHEEELEDVKSRPTRGKRKRDATELASADISHVGSPDAEAHDEEPATPREKRLRGRGTTGDDEGPKASATKSSARATTRRSTRRGAQTEQEDASRDASVAGSTAGGRDVSRSAELADDSERADASTSNIEVEAEEVEDAEEEEEEEEEDTSKGRRSRRSSTRAKSLLPTKEKSKKAGSSTPAQIDEEDEKQKKRQRDLLLRTLDVIGEHTHGNLFNAPIKEQDAPNYYQLIRHPTDMKTIRAKVKEGTIRSPAQLRRALNQMFANSLIYNRPGTEVHRMASEMREATEKRLDEFEQVQKNVRW